MSDEAIYDSSVGEEILRGRGVVDKKEYRKGSNLSNFERQAIETEIELTAEIDDHIKDHRRTTDNGYQYLGTYTPGKPNKATKRHLEWTSADVMRRRKAGLPMIPMYMDGRTGEWILNDADYEACRQGYACNKCLSWTSPVELKCSACGERNGH